MNRNAAPILVLGLMFVLVFGVICPCSDRTVRGASTITVPDDYSTIQEAINNAIAGDTILVNAGTYYEHVVVNKTVSLLGEDVRMTIVDGNGTGNVFKINKDSVNITGFTVQNGGGVLGNAGLRLDNTRLCSISRNRIRNNFAGIWFESASENQITANEITGNGDDGIVFNYSHNNTISENNIALHEYFGIVINWSHNNTICWNNVTQTLGLSHGDGINLWRSSHNSIFQNRVEENNRYGIRIEVQSNNNTLSHNTIGNCTTGLQVYDSSNFNLIYENNITECSDGIDVKNSRYTEIFNNTVAHNYGSDWNAGVRLESAGYTLIHDNEITDNHYGILLYSSSPRVSVYTNNVTENYVGIRVASGGSSYLNATENVIANNTASGIGITGWGSESNYATISRNIIANNFDGILLGRYSNYNTIFQNNINQNGFGFYIEYSAQNTIFGNNFLGNDQQVNMYTSSVNTWDGGYTSGGNYWSDLNGTDIYKGSNQDETGSDGIGDTPYVIDVNNRDNYPLMKPYPWDSHDIGITALKTSKTVVEQGRNVSISGMLFNYGNETESFDVTVYANATVLATFTGITLASRNSTTVTLTWNTVGFVKGNYTVWAYAEPVEGETDTADNNLRVTVYIGILGDVNADGKVDMKDIGTVVKAFGTIPGYPKWNPNADINYDGKVDMKDIGITIQQFGQAE